MELLQAIWGDRAGFRCIAKRPVGGELRNSFYEKTESVDLSKVSNCDVWFSPALFEGRKRLKTTAKSNCFYLDIDFGKPGGYANLTETLQEIERLIRVTDLIPNAVIHSGNGVHVYWIADQEVDQETWFKIAHALRDACVELGIKADHGITVDIARLLRVPNTFNWKSPDEPKPVELQFLRTALSVAEITSRLGKWITKAAIAKRLKSEPDNFALQYVQTPKDANIIADKCAQMRAFRDSKGNVPEPVWYSGLGVLALCENGEAIAHEWSKGHPKYSQAGTAEKFERSKSFAPSTCKRFYDVNPEGCKGCPHLEKISSPIQLGEKVTPVAVAVERVDTETQETKEEALPVPYGYEVGKEGIYALIEDPETGEPSRKVVCTQPIWVSRVMVAESGGDSEVEIVWLTARGQKKEASFKQSLLARNPSLAEWLFAQNINGFVKIDELGRYLRAGITLIARQYDEEVVYGKFGLTRAGFVIGEDLISSDGASTRARVSGAIRRDKIQAMSPVGRITEWSDATALLDKPEFWIHRFAVLAALGAPLFSITGCEGSVLSLAGESSGGKTTSANFGASAYGHPQAFTIDPSSTYNAFLETLRVSGGLPVICNEAATIDPHVLSDIIYAAANGKAKDRCDQSGNLKYSGGWRTLTVFTSNTHLMALSDKFLNEATRRRMFELTFDVQNKLPLTVGMKLNHVLNEHRGAVGRVFLSAAMRLRREITERVHARVEDLQRAVDSVHRYSIWLIAIVSVTAEIARELKLIQFGTDDMVANAVRQLAETHATQVTVEERIDAAIAEYTNEFQSGFSTRAVQGEIWIEDRPMGQITGRYDLDTKGTPIVLYIPAAKFHEYALARNIDVNQVKRFMAEREHKSQTVRLAKKAQPVRAYVMTIKGESDASRN